MAAPSSQQSSGGGSSSGGGNTTPFFGCKISLISKSEIRYEGILYTIDPKESTIALAKVRSFGSEDRPVERPVPPRDDIFEFIIFRASDIKDLIVDDPPPAPQLTDPAIIQAHTTSTSFPSSFPPGSINQSGGGGAAGPAPVSSGGQSQQQQATKPSALQQLQQRQDASHAQHQQQQAKARQQQQHQLQSSGGGDSESQQQAPQQQQPKQPKPTASNVAGAPGYSKVAGGGQLSSAASSQQAKQQQSTSSNQRQANATLSKPQQKPGSESGSGLGQQRLSNQQSSGLGGGQQQNGFVNRRQNQNQSQQQNRVIGENQNPNYHASQNGGGPGRFDRDRSNNQQGDRQQGGFRSFNQRFTPRGGMHQQGQQQFGGGGYRRGGQGQNYGGQHQMHQRNYINNRPGIGGGGGGGLNGPKFPPLPDGDFDFEKAQADFKILEEKLNALKLNCSVGGGDESGEGGSADSTDIIVPGIPLSAISVAALEQQDISGEPCYNKTKSFFDSISCEALEREKGSVQRVDWKQERKLNRETFGVVSARRPTFFRVNNRGGGFGGGYHQHRGGYRGGYGGGGYQNRGHRDNRDGNNQNRDNRDGNPMHRNGPRTSQSSMNNNNNVSSTTNGRTPAKSGNSPSNGLGGAGASPSAAAVVAGSAPIAAKN